MPSQLPVHYPQRVRPNRRRHPAPTARQVCLRFVLILVGLFILIAILVKMGIIQEPQTGGSSGFVAQCVVAAQLA